MLNNRIMHMQSTLYQYTNKIKLFYLAFFILTFVFIIYMGLTLVYVPNCGKIHQFCSAKGPKTDEICSNLITINSVISHFFSSLEFLNLGCEITELVISQACSRISWILFL